MKKKSLSNRIENIIKNTPKIINDKPFKEVVNNFVILFIYFLNYFN